MTENKGYVDEQTESSNLVEVMKTEDVTEDDVSEQVAVCRKERSKSLHVVQRQDRVPSENSTDNSVTGINVRNTKVAIVIKFVDHQLCAETCLVLLCQISKYFFHLVMLSKVVSAHAQKR